MNGFFRAILIAGIFLIFPFMVSAVDVEECHDCVPTEKDKLVLSFTGDMMAHIINYSMDDYSLIYQDIERIMQNDSLTFCNVEFPVNPELPQASYPVFNIHPEYVKAAVTAGVDVLALGNNHTADQGTKGLKATVQATKKMIEDFQETGRDIYYSGATDEPVAEFKPQTIYKDGWRIGYLSVSQFSNVTPDDGYMQLVDFRNHKQSDEFVNWIAGLTDDYDLFILAYHGGVEYYTEPVKKKTEFFLRLADAGVDVIWGHHPHVLQPIDIVEHNGGKSVIMNSLGNFISGQGRIADPVLPEEEWSYTGDSAIIQTVFSYDGHNPVLEDVTAIPIANMMTTNRDVVIIPIEELTHQAVPEPWMSFFFERFILMHDYFIHNIRYSELP